MVTFLQSHRHPDALYSTSGPYHKLKDEISAEAESVPLTSFDSISRASPGERKDSHFTSTSASDSNKFVVTTGWTFSLCILLLNGIISTCWGIALFIFSLGVVPIYYNLSLLGKQHPDVTNIVIALVAAISTMHISYIVQQIPAHYSHCLLVDGFTLGHIRWMQGVQQVSIFTRFPDRKNGGRFTRFFTRKQIFWLVAYFGIAFHTSSLVAILQPEIFYKNVMFNDAIPCGLSLNNLTLERDPFLSDDQQEIVDSFSFNIGTMLINYGEQLNGNTTTTIAGRVYRKDNYAYGAIGGLENGLQQVPGVLFNASCSQDNPTEGLRLWQSVFPNRSLPTLVAPLNDSKQIFVDSPIPTHLRNVTSSVPLDIDLLQSQAAMYALVDPSGSGALYSVGLNSDPSQAGILSTLICSWKTSPKLVQVQTIEYVARTLGSSDYPKYPSSTGRATLKTLQGMAEVARLGTSLQKSATYATTPNLIMPFGVYYNINNSISEPSQILETILADGGKASMTVYNVHFSTHPQELDEKCGSKNRTIAEHWRFHNSRNLGWVATIWTTAIGIYAIVAAIWMKGRRRMQKVSILDAPGAFSLGRDYEVGDTDVLRVQNGRVVVQEYKST
ncbi:hypothetical protein JR316_0006277 [Psilocybe cubensis]|uniref:Uncharacterized protein n=2 Tax=Psilocybe cubensis TaxID=181762 RepID=A0ACB8H173_PSICU|nr:hypothetical protein JR316_0006277 [Psilocybe cubensis]KAH9481750.1 hypothetical protein JR316_0006277 [Psilocybe cubensis]